jgi:LysM repeat protein
MKYRCPSRTFLVIPLMGILILGLAACKIPASKGPETPAVTSEGFPVPGETQPPGGGQVNTSATQTARAFLPGTVPTQVIPQNPTPDSAYPAPTNIPGAPTSTSGPVIYVQPTPGGPPLTYILAEGEFPFCIARRFNVNQNELLELNGLGPGAFVYAGQELKIPQTGNPFDGERTLHEHPTTYKIQTGDTLNSIACYFGDISPDMIALQNSLTTADLPPGEVLVIP